jgi:hypothetical protein
MKFDHACMIARRLSSMSEQQINPLYTSTLAIISQSFSEIEARLARLTAE